jgi:glycosyltransferase involved in cell wall biosynthesis
MNTGRRLRILTWHVHGNYLYNLTQVPHDFYLLTDAAKSTHYSGRSGSLPWGDNVHDAPVDLVQDMHFDAILFQSRDAWDEGQHRWLSASQRRLPRLYLEHDPPQGHPTDTRHWAADPEVMIVHCTPFNALMWDNGPSPVRVVEHGIKPLREVRYDGSIERGLVVVNNLMSRGRRLGLDVYQQMASQVPLRLVGMNSEQVPGGTGEVRNDELPEVMAAHRFFFNPIRYTSLGLAILEAMMAGVPIVGLATTELSTVIHSGVNGFIDTRPERLVQAMQYLLEHPKAARQLGEQGRRTAMERFNIDRFTADWQAVLHEATS